MKRPIVFMCISVILGLVLGRYISKMEYIVFVLMLVSGFAFISKKKLKTDFVFVMPIIFLLGISVMGLHNVDNVNYEGKVQIEGWVKDISLSRKGNQILDLDVTSVHYQDEVIETDYSVRVYIQDEDVFQIGNLLVIEGYLSLPAVPANDGAFDNYIYLHTKGYDYSLYSLSAELKGTKQLNIVQTLAKFRGKMSLVFDQIYPGRESSIVKAMVIGDTSSIDEDLRVLYSDSGIAHVLAISGLHIGIIASMMIWIFDCLKINKRKSAIIIVGLLWVYAVFVGFKISVLRAVIMVSVMLLGRLFYRRSDSLSSLSFAAIVLLVINPWQLWDVGFQLSFVSVLTLVFISKFNTKPNNSIKYKIKSLFIASLCISITTTPIVAWYFYKIPMLGCFANLLVIPLMGFAVVFSMLSGVMGLININLASYIGGGIAYTILRFYENVCIFFTSLPFATFLVGRPSLVSLLIFYGIFFSIYLKQSKILKTHVSLIILINLFAFTILSNRMLFKVDSMDFLDVGQGDCAILRTHDNKTYIFDTGGRSYIGLGENTGVSIIIPYLQSHGISEVNGLFISHMDSDHALGAIEIINEYKINEVFVSDYIWETVEIYNAIEESARITETIISKMNQGDYLNLNDIYINCYYPQSRGTPENLDDNKGSLVLKLSIGETDFLFTGDIGFEDEEEILALGYNLDADVLKISHHGSKYASSYEFLDEVGVEYAIISRGLNNNYGHPSEEVLERLNCLGAKAYDTALNGQISVKTDGNAIWIDTKKR